MLSLELARKLKDVGLVWEPETGDGFRNVFMETDHFITYRNIDRFKSITHIQEYAEKNDFVWLPSLSQLLAEIEGQQFSFAVFAGPFKDGKYQIEICKRSDKYIDLDVGGKFPGDTPEDAAASALIWILEREKDG